MINDGIHMHAWCIWKRQVISLMGKLSFFSLTLYNALSLNYNAQARSKLNSLNKPWFKFLVSLDLCMGIHCCGLLTSSCFYSNSKRLINDAIGMYTTLKLYCHRGKLQTVNLV